MYSFSALLVVWVKRSLTSDNSCWKAEQWMFTFRPLGVWSFSLQEAMKSLCDSAFAKATVIFLKSFLSFRSFSAGCMSVSSSISIGWSCGGSCEGSFWLGGVKRATEVLLLS